MTTTMQKIEDIVTSKRGYDSRNVLFSDFNPNLENTQEELDLCLATMNQHDNIPEFREGVLYRFKDRIRGRQRIIQFSVKGNKVIPRLIGFCQDYAPNQNWVSEEEFTVSKLPCEKRTNYPINFLDNNFGKIVFPYNLGFVR